MTRGPPPKKGLDDAISVATARGTVMRFVRDAENPCDFLIKGNDRLILVSVRKARRLGGSREEMEREFRETIDRSGPFPYQRRLSVSSGHIPGEGSGGSSASNGPVLSRFARTERR
jgi:hypothetical protein